MIRFHKKLQLLLFLGISAFYLNAQQNLSLSQAIEIGLRNNFQIQIADVNTLIAQNNNHWAMAGRYPSVNLTLTLPNSLTDQNNPTSFLPELTALGTGVTPGIEASWVLFDGYRIRFTKEQFEKLEELSQGEARVVVENAIQAIILAYQNALIQREQIGVLENVLTLSRDRIRYEEIKKEYGQSGTFELLQTQDAYLNDSTNYLIQLNSYEIALRNLNLAMGLEDLTIRFNLTDQLAFEAPPYLLTDLKTKMLSSNHALQNARVNKDLAKVNTKIQESAKYPTLAIGAGGNYNYSKSKVNGTFQDGNILDTDATIKTINAYLNITASYNLFDGGVKQRQIENALMQETVADLGIEELKRNLTAQLENTLATYDNQRQLVTLTQNLIENAEQNLKIADERFKGGVITSFDYRTIQLNYINASQARLNAIFNLKTTETDLIRLTGGLVR